MREDCIEAVTQAIGRKLKPGEADGIQKRIENNMAMIARSDPKAWQGMSMADRRSAAAEESAKQFIADTQMKAQRVALGIVAQAKLAQRFTEQTAQGVDGANAVERILWQASAYVKAVQSENFSLMFDAIQSAEPRFFGFIDNPEANRDFIGEVFGKDTGNEVAKKGAKSWLETIEQMRQRFNRGGADVGKLDYGYVPQSHDQAKILKAGAEKWVADTANFWDRSRYFDDAGERLGDAAYTEMLGEAFQTLSTGGLNKLEPGKVEFGSSLANRGSKSRQLHFKDDNAWLEYHALYGNGSLYESMQNHVQALSLNIGVVEELGPNTKAGYQLIKDMAIKQDGEFKLVGVAFANLDSLYRVLTNENNQAVNPTMAKINQDIRNITVAAKLQGVVLSAINDVPTLIATSKYHNLPMFRTMATTFKSFGKDYQSYANVTGLVIDSIVSDMSRFADGNFKQAFTGNLAHATNKLSLINKWTDSLKTGFRISMMGALGKMKDTPWQNLKASDRAKLKFQGVSIDTYKVWQKAIAEDWRGSKMLTPQSIRNIPDEALFELGAKGGIQNDPNRVRDEAVARLLGFIIDESEYAITTPDLTTRASLGGGTQKGTFEGEMARHASVFKSFPVAMANRQIRRALAYNGENGSPGYAVSLMLGLIGFGALSTQLKSLVDGKDPADMTEPKFWGKAMAQGGGLGIYGDLLYTGLGGSNRAGQANYFSLFGPVAGTAGDLASVSLGNLGQVMRGEKTDTGAELLRFTQQNAPMLNLWYIRAAIRHMLVDDMQETVSPGYLNRMKTKAYKDFGQSYWWEPGETVPDRAPDFEAAIGE